MGLGSSCVNTVNIQYLSIDIDYDTFGYSITLSKLMSVSDITMHRLYSPNGSCRVKKLPRKKL